MKRLFVQQQISNQFIGGVTPDDKKYVYVVKKLQNTTWPEIGAALTKNHIDDLCNDADWSITIN